MEAEMEECAMTMPYDGRCLRDGQRHWEVMHLASRVLSRVYVFKVVEPWPTPDPAASLVLFNTGSNHLE